MRVVTYIIAILLGSCLYAQDGSPDLSFGDNGLVITDINEGFESFRAVTEDSQGRIYLIGLTENEGVEQNVLIRYLTNGTIDSSFGNDGIIITEIMDGLEFNDIKKLGENQFLILSGDNAGINTLTGYFSDGSINPSFGTNGTILIDDFGVTTTFHLGFDDSIFIHSMVLISDIQHIAIRKFTSQGLADATFGIDGKTLVPLAEGSSFSTRSLKVLPDNELYILFSESIGPDVALSSILKLDVSGNIAPDYGVEGYASIPVPDEYYHCECVSSENKNTLVSCLYYDWMEEISYWETRKIKSNGINDNTFYSNAASGVVAKLIQPNQRYIADSSISDFEGGISIAYRRHFSNGYLDPSFNLIGIHSELGNYNLITLQSGELLLGGDDIWYAQERNFVLQKFKNSPLGIAENTLIRVLISPNPSRGIFEITLSPLNDTVSEYRIVDLSGKLIQKGTVDSPNFSIDLSAFEAGMYFLNINHSTYKLLKN